MTDASHEIKRRKMSDGEDLITPVDGKVEAESKVTGEMITPADEKIDAKLRVMGEIITVNLDELRSKPETMLGKMFTSGIAKANEEGEYEIHNVQPSILKGILDYYKDGLITIPVTACYEDLEKACDYLQIPFKRENFKDWKRFFQIMTNYHKTKVIANFFENQMIPYIEKLSAKGLRRATFYLFKKGDVPSPHRPVVNNVNSFALFLEFTLFIIFVENVIDCGVITNYFASKGFKDVKLDVKLTDPKNQYVICNFVW